MKRTLVAGTAVAVSLGLAGLAQAQTIYPMTTYPASPYERVIPPMPYHLDGTPRSQDTLTSREMNCAPLGVPTNGVGAMPPSNNICP